MKKWSVAVLLLVCAVGLIGCKSLRSASEIPESTAAKVQEIPQTAVTEEKKPAVIMPLPVTVDLEKLEDCTVAVSLEKGAFHTDETGTVRMDVTVFVYDMYDLVDISLMEAGDRIWRGQEEVLISRIERREDGLVLINGGPEEEGFGLYTDDNTVYYERGYNDTKFYYPLGTVSLPVSPDFVCEDASLLDRGTVYYRAEDFLRDPECIDAYFNADNTTIRMEDGLVTAMTRVYTP